jgi:hypothetical protein
MSAQCQYKGTQQHDFSVIEGQGKLAIANSVNIRAERASRKLNHIPRRLASRKPIQSAEGLLPVRPLSQKASATISAAEKLPHDYASNLGPSAKTSAPKTLLRTIETPRNSVVAKFERTDCLFVRVVAGAPSQTRCACDGGSRRMQCTHNHARAHRCRYTQMRRAIRLITHCRADGEHLFANRVTCCRMIALMRL